MCPQYALTVCLALLVLQTARIGSADSVNVETGLSTPEAAFPAPSKRRIVAHAVDFDPTPGAIRPEAEPVLNEAVQLLGGDVPVIVIVAPPVDRSRTDTYRLMLARRHAKAVRRYLLDHGIAADRIVLRNDSTNEVAAVITPANRLAHSQPVELHAE